MSRAGHHVRTVGVNTRALGQNGVVRTFLPRFRLGDVRLQRRAQNDLRVPVARATLGTHQVVVLSYAVEVRPLNPDGSLLYMSAAAHYLRVLANDAVALGVEAEDAYGTLALVVGSAIHRTIVYDVCRAVLVEEERRVDTVNLRQANGVAPPGTRVFRLHEEVTHAHARSNHVVGLVLRVVLDVGRKDAAADALSVERQL